MNLEMLQQPLDPSHIKKRKQGNKQLSYIEGYYAIDKANEIFGYGSWSKDITELQCVQQTEREVSGKKRYDVFYLCRVDISVSKDGEESAFLGTSFEDVGYGNGSSYAGFGEAHELAAKEAVTDATKRALRHFGAQFGNTLYDKDFKPETPAKKKKVAAPETPTTKSAAATLPKMTDDQRQRMNRIWKFVDDNMNPDKDIKAEDIACATYACLTHWPDSAKDEEHVINNIGLEKTPAGSG